MRKRIVARMAWVLPLGAALALVAINHQDLVKIISMWFSGQQTSGSTLWGVSMVWWGRIGKMMQFVAACAIILDLVGPARLRKVGQAAREQLRGFPAFATRISETEKVVKLHERIERQIVVLRAPYSDVASQWVLINSTSALPAQPWFTADMIDQLRTRIRRGVMQVTCECRTNGGHDQPCSEQVEYMQGKVREFFLDHLPPHERQLFDNQKDLHRIQAWTSLTISPIILAAIFGAGFLTKKGVFDWWLAVPAVLAFGILLHLVEKKSASIGTWIRSSVAGGMARAVATALDRGQPGHPLRWAGFFIFILGFSLDLLAS